MDIKFLALRPLAVAAALIAGATAGSHQANAALMLTLESGGTTVAVTDNGVGDTDSTVGVINFSGAVGNFIMNMVGGFGEAYAPWPTVMDLLGGNMSSTAGGTITVTLEDDGYVPLSPMTPFLSSIGGTLGSGATLSAKAYIDTTSTPGTLGTLLADNGSFTGVGSFGSDVLSGAVSTPGPYGLAVQVTLTHTGSALTTYDQQIMVSEPATLGIFGLTLAGIGVIARRRRRR